MSTTLTIQDATRLLAGATRAHMEAQLAHADVKHAALTRLCQQVNPLTNKPHSATSAEAVLEQDADYRRSRERLIDAAVDVVVARGAYDAAVADGYTDEKRAADEKFAGLEPIDRL